MNTPKEDQKNIHSTFERIASGLEEVSRAIETVLPKAIVKQVSTFGNSAHVVLSRDLVGKKVGVVLLSDDLVAGKYMNHRATRKNYKEDSE